MIEANFLGNPMVTDDAVVSIDAIAAEFGKTTRTIARWVKTGALPRPINAGTRSKPIWRVGQLRAHNRRLQEEADRRDRELRKRRELIEGGE